MVTQTLVKQTLDNIKEIRKDAQRSINKIADDEGNLPPKPRTAGSREAKEYNDMVKEYDDAMALIKEMNDAYETITAYYLMPNDLKGKKKL
jgi:hypothetical protein